MTQFEPRHLFNHVAILTYMPKMKTKKVFLVEDNLEITRMYERAFRFNGHEVEIAYDGESALEKLKTGDTKPGVIVMDVMIPHMHGTQLLQEIRRDPNLADVPVAILTNSFHQEDKDQFMALGADLYLVKIENQSRQVVEKIEALIHKHTNV